MTIYSYNIGRDWWVSKNVYFVLFLTMTREMIIEAKVGYIWMVVTFIKIKNIIMSMETISVLHWKALFVDNYLTFNSAPI